MSNHECKDDQYKPGDVLEDNWGPERVREYLEERYGDKLKYVEPQPVLPSLGDELKRVQAVRNKKS